MYDSTNKLTRNLEPLQHSDVKGIIVHSCYLLIIVHDCYTLKKALIAICDMILENRPSCHIWYFEKYRFLTFKPLYFPCARL